MGATAFGTSDPTEPEPDISGRKFNSPSVVTMYGKAGGMPTGTGQLMELDLINNRIIKGYHSIVDRHRVTCVYEQ